MIVNNAVPVHPAAAGGLPNNIAPAVAPQQGAPFAAAANFVPPQPGSRKQRSFLKAIREIELAIGNFDRVLISDAHRRTGETTRNQNHIVSKHKTGPGAWFMQVREGRWIMTPAMRRWVDENLNPVAAPAGAAQPPAAPAQPLNVQAVPIQVVAQPVAAQQPAAIAVPVDLEDTANPLDELPAVDVDLGPDMQLVADTLDTEQAAGNDNFLDDFLDLDLNMVMDMAELEAPAEAIDQAGEFDLEALPDVDDDTSAAIMDWEM